MSRRPLIAAALCAAALVASSADAKGPTGTIELAANARGDAAAAWARSDGRSVVAQIAALDDPARPVTVPFSFGDDAPTVGVDGRGGLWWAWSDDADGTSRIMVGHRGPDGTASRPRVLATAPRGALWRLRLAVSARGGAAAWIAGDGRGVRLEAAALSGRARAVLWRGSGQAEAHEVAVDARGRGLVAWSAGGRVRAAERTGETWRIRTLGAAAWREAIAPAIAAGPGDRAAVAWSGEGGRVMVAERTPDGAWRTVVVAPEGREPRLAYAPDGTLTAAFTAGVLLEARVLVAHRVVGGGWSAPAAVPSTGLAGCRPALAAAPDGTLALAWTAAVDGYVCDQTEIGLAGRSGIAVAALRDGAPGPARVLARADGRNDQPRVAVDRAGAFRVVWSRLPAGVQTFDGLRARMATVPPRGGAARVRDLYRADDDVFPPTIAARDLRVADGQWVARVDVAGADTLDARLARRDRSGRLVAVGRPRETGAEAAGSRALALGDLAPGTYRLTVRARDRRGNAATMVRTFTTRFARLAVSGSEATFLLPDAASVVARLRDPSGHRVLRVLAAGRMRAGMHRVLLGPSPEAGRLELRAGSPDELPIVAWAAVTAPR